MNGQETVKEALRAEGISLFGVLRAEDCTVERPEIFTRRGDFEIRAALIFAVPYYAGKPENISAYAAARDYHLYMRDLHARLCRKLETEMPEYRFLGFADHSPIDERLAAVKCGIGVFGKNGLVLTRAHSSFVFLGEILTNAPADLFGDPTPQKIRTCENCGACRRACPTGILRGEDDRCLSEITQRKGELAEDEKALMRKYHTAWGCDGCQTCCPWTKRAEDAGTLRTTIPFFLEDRVEKLSSGVLAGMDKAAFLSRAFSWRGRKTAERNAAILEETEKE